MRWRTTPAPSSELPVGCRFLSIDSASLGIEAVYPKRSTTRRASGHKVYPYLLRNVEVARVDQVWSSDITYVPLSGGWLYLVAVMDWHSRKVLSWELSNKLDGLFCCEALDAALAGAAGGNRPEVFNTDQGCQFMSRAFTQRLEACGVAISMDGKGRALDNVFIESAAGGWRSVKYEELYLKGYASVAEARRGMTDYFEFYNGRRRHQSLGRRTPSEVFEEVLKKTPLSGRTSQS